MSTVEDRLTRALEARADLVGPEDLRPLGVPDAHVTWLRRPATYVVAAAACAAAIAAPFVVDLGDGDTAPQPPVASQTADPTLPPQEDVGGGWKVVNEVVRVDVDGDGAPDRVRVREEPGEPLIGPRLRVEADLASGEQVFGVIDSGEVGYGVPEGVQLDDDPGLELLLYRDGLPFAVLDLVDGRLTEPQRPETPPLLNGTVPAEDGRGRQSELWTDDRTLYSWLTVDTYSGGEPLNLPPEYEVDVEQWSLVDGTLVPRGLGEQCIDVVDGPVVNGSTVPAPCADGGVTPTLFPSSDGTIGVGQSFEVPKGSVTFTVSLEGDADGDGSVRPGSAELVVDVPGSGERRLALPGGWAPTAYTTPVRMSDVDLSILVTQEGGDSTTMTLVTLRDDRLVAAETSGPVPFGGGFQGADARSFATWIGPDHRLFTRRAREAGSDDYDVWSWSLGGSVAVEGAPTLQPAEEGCFRLANDSPGAEVVPCGG